MGETADDEIEFLITIEKQKENVRTENSQQQLSFNLSATVRNSTNKKEASQLEFGRWEGQFSGTKLEETDHNYFFDHFESHYQLKGLTPIKGNQEEEVIKTSVFPNRVSPLGSSTISREGFFNKNNHRVASLNERDSKKKLKEILKERPLKPFQNDFIKINNISPLLIGNRSKIDRKNTPQTNNPSKKFKTVENSRKNHSTVMIKRACHQQSTHPSIFFNRGSITDLLKKNEWKEVENCLNREFQIKKTKCKRRPSNKGDKDNIFKNQHTYQTIRI